MSYDRDYEQAQKLFRSFHGRSAAKGEIIGVEGLCKPQLVLEVGKVLTLDYRSVGNGVEYTHDFEHALPTLYVTPRGEQAFIIGGSYVFTRRGFIR